MHPQLTLQRGFSLVELMVVIAIIALLSAIALPIFGDYLTRARAAELLSGGSSAKLAMAEWAMLNADKTEWPALQKTFSSAAFSFTSDHVKLVTYKRATAKSVAAIVVTGNASVEKVIMYLEGTLDKGSVVWKCTADTTHLQWLPSTCVVGVAAGIATSN